MKTAVAHQLSMTVLMTPDMANFCRQCARGPYPQAARSGRLRLCESLRPALCRDAFGRSGGFPAAHSRRRARHVPGKRQLHRHDFDGSRNQGRHGEHPVAGRAPREQLLLHDGRGERGGEARARRATRSRDARSAAAIRSGQDPAGIAAGAGSPVQRNEGFRCAAGRNRVAPNARSFLPASVDCMARSRSGGTHGRSPPGASPDERRRPAPSRARQHAGRARLHRCGPEIRRLQRPLQGNVQRAAGIAATRQAVSRLPALSRRARLLRTGRRRCACRQARRESAQPFGARLRGSHAGRPVVSRAAPPRRGRRRDHGDDGYHRPEARRRGVWRTSKPSSRSRSTTCRARWSTPMAN